jgi:hypothetical protein
LAEPQVVQPDLGEERKPGGDLRLAGEGRRALGRGHLQDVGDRPAGDPDLEDAAVVARAAADLAGHGDVRQVIEAEGLPAGPAASLAAALGCEERKMSLFETFGPGFVRRGEEAPDRVEKPQVGEGNACSVLGWSLDPGRNDSGKTAETADPGARDRTAGFGRGQDDVEDKARLPAPGDPGHGRQEPRGDDGVDATEIVRPGPDDLE